jgi:dUTP pyrophosphatase
MYATKKLFRANPTDAGLDIESSEDLTIAPGMSALVSTGLHLAVPTGCVGILKSRSGLSVKHRIEVGAGVIDSGYRGEVRVHLYNLGTTYFDIKAGDRIAQLLTVPVILQEYEVVDELPEHDGRGENGFGSSGV